MAMTDVDKAQATPKAEWLKPAANPVAQAVSPAQGEWTLWEEGHSTLTKIDILIAHLRKLRNDLSDGLMTAQRMIGEMPKRP